MAHYDTYARLNGNQPILVAGEYDDLDPFSDTSNPVSPLDELASPISDFPDGEEEAKPDSLELDNHRYSAIKQTRIGCCRCPNEQALGASWTIDGSQDHAVCDRCTAAFCGKCTLGNTSTIVQFDAKGKAQIPPDAADVVFFSFCPSCGGMEPVPAKNVRRSNGVAQVDAKGLSCLACRQKMPAFGLKVAWVRTQQMASPLASIPEQDDPIEQMGDRPAMPARYSDGYLSLRQRMSFMSGKKSTVNKMRRWTSLSSYGSSR
jgi:hypothetical protein